MKSLLRSTFLADPNDRKDLGMRNYLMLVNSGLGFEVPVDNVLWTFIRSFVQAHNHVPEIVTLRTHFKHLREDTVLDRLDELKGLSARSQGDFEILLDTKAEERRQRVVVDLLKTAAQIVQQGILEDDKNNKKEKKLIKGAVAAVKYVMDHSHEITTPTLGTRLSGEVTRDGEDFLAEYERVEADPLAGVGQYTGFPQMDSVVAGAHRHELWIHAAFTGGMKSTFILNWAYNQAVYYRSSSLVFSLEMPYEQCRRILYSIHSSHPKFKKIRHKFGLQSNPQATIGLPYDHIKKGTLSEWHPNAKEFLVEHVIPDFLDPKNNYGLIHIEVADPDKSDFTVADLRQKAELIYTESPFHLVFVDHVGLMAPRKWVPSTTERLNEIIRDIKRMAGAFRRGQGIAMVALFQIGRGGFKEAMKKKEKTGTAQFDLTQLSYANEAERCLIPSTYTRTSLGFMPLGSVSLQAQTQVWSSTGWRKVHQKFDNGVRRVWKLTTDRGSVVEGTGPHRVRVLGDGQLGWCAIQDLTPDQYVAGTFGGDCWPTAPPALDCLSFWKGEKPNGQQGVPLTTPETLTPGLAYLLGAWDGDGKVHAGGVSWTGNRKEVHVREAIRSAFLTTFDHTLPMHESPSRPGSFDLVKWSKPVKRWFEQVAGARAGEVPRAVLGAPKDLVCAYLRGLFDTDGWVNNNGIVGVSLKAACEPFLRQIQMLLTALGVDSYLGFSTNYLKVTGRHYGGVILRVRSREGRAAFSRLVGFTEPHKQDRLQVQVVQGKQAKRRGSAQLYPVPETALRVYRLVHPKRSPQTEYKRSFYNLPYTIRKAKGLVPRGVLEQLVAAAVAKDIDNPDVRYLQKLLSLHVMRVVSSTDTGIDAPVMDLEVEGDHEYQTGPVLSHNSADIVTTSWIDDDLRNENKVQFQCLKTRDTQPFEMFWARVEWPCRRLLPCTDMPSMAANASGGGNKAHDQKDIDAAADELMNA